MTSHATRFWSTAFVIAALWPGLSAAQTAAPQAPATNPTTTTGQPATTAAAGQPAPTAAGQPAAPAMPAVAVARVFGADAGMIFNQIKAEKTIEFEAVMARLKEALQESRNPVRREQAASWKMFRSLEPGPGGSVLYVFVIDPAVKGADYTVSKILAEAFPVEAQALYQQFSASYAGGQSLLNLQLVQNFDTASPTVGPRP